MPANNILISDGSAVRLGRIATFRSSEAQMPIGDPRSEGTARRRRGSFGLHGDMTPRPSDESLRVRPLPWHRRLEARVAVGVTLLVGASLAAVLLATAHIVQTNALSRATVELQAARVAFYHLIDNRSAFSAAQLRLVTELPVFRAHFPAAAQDSDTRANAARLAADPATLDTMVEEYRRTLAAQFTIVTDATGRWIASSGWNAGRDAPTELSQGIQRASSGVSHHSIVVHAGLLYLLVTEPARFADEVLGTVTAGYKLDDAFARELALTTGCDVNLLAGGRLSGSSLPLAQQRLLLDLLTRAPRALGQLTGPADLSVSAPFSAHARAGSFGQLREPADLGPIDGSRYVSGTYPVSRDAAEASPGTLILLKDWRPSQASIDQVQASVLKVGATMFLLALGGGLVVSRRIARPLSQMAAVTGDVAAGHWDRSVPVEGTDEVAALALAFNEMTTSLSHWHTEARSKTAELQDSYEQFFAVAQSAHDAIVSTDEHGRIQFWNLSARRMFRYAGQVLNRPVEELLDEASRKAYRERVERLRRNDIMSEGMMEGVGIRGDGSEFPIELSLATWTAANQAHFTAIVRDVTERKHAEAALRLSETELRQAQKMDAVGRLAGGVAHDFNNLLTAIRGYAELLADDLDEHDGRRDDAMQIIRAADTAGSLTRQLLAFSRKQILAPKVLCLTEILCGMEKMLARLIGEDVELTVRSEPGLWSVKADSGQIEQVVMNLSVNARDAMPTGGRLSIALANVVTPEPPAAGLSGEYVALSVTDTGSGMDADTIAHIFEPFFTTKDDGHGTGLGLAMVDGIIEQSDGTITVDSRPGHGTCFRILLPRVQEVRAVPETAVTSTKVAVFETVLLVEDEPGVRRFTHQVLTREGYHVLEAARGDEALLQAAGHPGPIHLLLTDVVMPGMSGRILWEQLSALRDETRVLFVSGYTDDAVVRHGIRESGLPYLQKPFSVTQLSDSIRRAMAIDRTAIGVPAPTPLPA